MDTADSTQLGSGERMRVKIKQLYKGIVEAERKQKETEKTGRGKEAKESGERSALAERRLEEATRYGWSALMVASKQGNKKEVESLLYDGAQVNFQDREGWSALMVASKWGNYEVAKLLLDHGADRYLQSTKWESALSLALLQEHSDIVTLLDKEVSVLL